MDDASRFFGELPARRAATITKMSNDRFDALNTLKVRWERSGEEWSAVEGIADDLGESMSVVERLLDPCVQEGLVERRGIDRDPEYRLTRSGEMHVADGS